MEQISLDEDRPLQLVSVESDKDSGQSKLEFHGEELQEILSDEKFRDKPVAVISTVGAFRKGKTYLMSLLVKYFTENGDSNWGESDMPTFSFKAGSVRHTTGIWVWSRPFVVVDRNGVETVVLLVDSQGTFDHNTTIQMSSILFGFTCLLSSNIIFNIMHNVQEDDIQHLLLFSELARLAHSEGSSLKPFQNIMFLVRDWQFDEEFEPGLKGGKQYITRNLLDKNQTEEGRAVRRQLLECFGQMQCFLMPHPGEQATRQNFSGKLSDTSSKFSEHVEDLIKDVHTKVTPRHVNGSVVHAHHFVSTAALFFKALMTVDAPRPLYEVTASINLKVAADSSITYYCSQMKKYDRPDKSSPREQLLEDHESNKAAAEEYFKRHRLMGSEDMKSKTFEQLQDMIEKIYDDYNFKNDQLLKAEEQRPVSILDENLKYLAACASENANMAKEKLAMYKQHMDVAQNVCSGYVQNIAQQASSTVYNVAYVGVATASFIVLPTKLFLPAVAYFTYKKCVE